MFSGWYWVLEKGQEKIYRQIKQTAAEGNSGAIKIKDRETMKVFIIGCGVMGQQVLDILLEQKSHEIAGFLDDNPNLLKTMLNGVEVHGPINLLSQIDTQDIGVVIGVANYRVRSLIASRLAPLRVSWPSVIHPSAVIMKSARVGQGNFIQGVSYLDTASRTGNYVIICAGATTGYGCVLEDFVLLGTGVHLAGKVVVGRGTFIGTGASVCPSVRIGAGTVIGAGAAVTQDIPDGVVAVGIPARVIKKVDEGFDWSGRVLSGTR